MLLGFSHHHPQTQLLVSLIHLLAEIQLDLAG
jgi:hypothetical protein